LSCLAFVTAAAAMIATSAPPAANVNGFFIVIAPFASLDRYAMTKEWIECDKYVARYAVMIWLSAVSFQLSAES
jgi:hypothetical protein